MSSHHKTVLPGVILKENGLIINECVAYLGRNKINFW